MKKILVLLQAIFCVLALVGSAAASNITIQSAYRVVFGEAAYPEIYEPPPYNFEDADTWLIGPWDENISVLTILPESGGTSSARAQAYQHSSITLGNALAIDASGGTHAEVHGNNQVENVEAQSNIYLTFTVLETMRYSFAINDLSGFNNFMHLGTTLWGSDILSLEYLNFQNIGDTYEGTLGPGTYYFEFISISDIEWMGSSYDETFYDIEFTLNDPIIPPEDSDGDGVPNYNDICPDTPQGEPVDANGCSDAQVDFDLDGICDPGAPSTGPSACTGIDNCPTVANPLQTDINDDGFGDDCVDPSVSIPDDAVIAADAIIGSGTQINKGVTVESGAVIGENVILNKDSTVGENTEIGDNTVINQNVTIGSDVVIGENVTIGRNVTIGNGVTIGDNTVINQGTVIGDDATIGMNVVLGRDVIVAATASVEDGTVVPKDTVVTP